MTSPNRIIGEGTYGCVYYPALSCAEGCDRIICTSDSVTKVLSNEEAIIEEENNKIMDRIDPENLFHYGNNQRHICNIDISEFDKISGCNPLKPNIINYRDYLGIRVNLDTLRSELEKTERDMSEINKLTNKLGYKNIPLDELHNIIDEDQEYTDKKIELNKPTLIYYPYGGQSLTNFLRELMEFAAYIESGISEHKVPKIYQKVSERLKKFNERTPDIIDKYNYLNNFLTAEIINILMGLSVIVYGANQIYLHDYCHGDIKSGNILINQEGHITLIDHGLLKKITDVIDKRGEHIYDSPYFWGYLSYLASNKFYEHGVELFINRCANEYYCMTTINNSDKRKFKDTVTPIYKDVLALFTTREEQIRYFMTYCDYNETVALLFYIYNTITLKIPIKTYLQNFLRDKMNYNPAKNPDLSDLVVLYLNFVLSLIKCYNKQGFNIQISEQFQIICDKVGVSTNEATITGLC